MAIDQFPDIEKSDANGLLAMGGDLEVESLLLAYRSGIFPWPVKDAPILWFAPPYRAILDFSNFKVPQRLKRDLKKTDFSFRYNTMFDQVIEACAFSNNRRGAQGTWITPEMIDAYKNLHHAGYAVSFETFDAHDNLVGGLYGVRIDKMFAGESMFYLKTHASKFALINAIDFLTRQGLTWMDIQMMTPLLKSFGAQNLTRVEFMEKLNFTLNA